MVTSGTRLIDFSHNDTFVTRRVIPPRVSVQKYRLHQITYFHISPIDIYNIASSGCAVNDLFVKEMSSLADNFDFIVPRSYDMISVTLNTPHLPYTIFIIVGCHTNKTVKWAVPLNASITTIAIKGANKITVFHQSASSLLSAHHEGSP